MSARYIPHDSMAVQPISSSASISSLTSPSKAPVGGKQSSTSSLRKSLAQLREHRSQTVRYAFGVYDGETQRIGGCLLRHGYGTMRYSGSGNTYEGEWVEGMPHGMGVKQYKNGDVFEGEWWCGMRQGHGVYHWISGSVYEGAYVDDLPHGEGTLRTLTTRYSGQWRGGEKHGEGVEVTGFRSRGSLPLTRQGRWKHNQRHGIFTVVYHSNAEKAQELWDEDQLVGRDISNTIPFLTYPRVPSETVCIQSEWIDTKAAKATSNNSAYELSAHPSIRNHASLVESLDVLKDVLLEGTMAYLVDLESVLEQTDKEYGKGS